MDDAGNNVNLSHTKLYPIALYVVLFSFLGVRLHAVCWTPLFELPLVRSSAIRILWLKILLVVQALLIGTLSTDFLLQRAEYAITLPVIPMFLVGLICTTIELVYACTKSFRGALCHTIIAHFIPFMASVVLHLSHIAAYPKSHDLGILCLYGAGTIAVLWNDLRAVALNSSRSAIVSPAHSSHSMLDDEVSIQVDTTTSADSFEEQLLRDGNDRHGGHVVRASPSVFLSAEFRRSRSRSQPLDAMLLDGVFTGYRSSSLEGLTEDEIDGDLLTLADDSDLGPSNPPPVAIFSPSSSASSTLSWSSTPGNASSSSTA